MKDNFILLNDKSKIINRYLKGLNVSIKGKNNRIIIYDNNDNLKKYRNFVDLKIKIIGDNNIIKLYSDIYFDNCFIEVCGNENLFSIGETSQRVNNSHFKFFMGSNGRKLEIGNNLFSNGAKFYLDEDDSFIKFGDNCTLSWNVHILNSDFHSITDKNGCLLNKGKNIFVGNNVWLGEGCKVLKGVSLENGTIAGAGSVISKSFKDINIILAGNPAKIIKREVYWNMEKPHLYEKKHLA